MFAQSSWYLANLENIEIIKLISSVGLQLHSVYPSIYSPVYNLGVLALCYILFNLKKNVTEADLQLYLLNGRLSRILQRVK